MPDSSDAADRSRTRFRIALAVIAPIGLLAMFMGDGGLWTWIGASLLIAAVVLGFLDGYRGWSER